MWFVMSIVIAMMIVVLIAVVVGVNGGRLFQTRNILPVRFIQKMERYVVGVKRKKQGKKSSCHQSSGMRIFARSSGFTNYHQRVNVPDQGRFFKENH